MVERLRGRKGVEQRKRRRALHPVCAECAKSGIVRPTDEIDHIIPLHQGGEDTDDNTQGLCLDHHRIKTAIDGDNTFAASNHPDWLKPSAIPLTIVCGPPCSGKTTHVEQNAGPFDTVIDMDAIALTLRPSYRQWHGKRDKLLLNQAIRLRNAMLGSLCRARGGNAWFIVAAPTKSERAWWQRKLGGGIALLDPGKDECKRRAIERGTPAAVDGIERWYEAARVPWKTPREKVVRPAIGEDGWPVT